MNKILITIIGVVLVAGGIYFYTNSQQTQVREEDTTLQETTNLEENTVAPNGNAIEIAVATENMSFDPNKLMVKKGDTVRIMFTVTQGTHDWVLDEFNVRSKILSSGETETIEFVADKAGTFEYYCSVPGHRLMGMKGTFIVEE